MEYGNGKLAEKTLLKRKRIAVSVLPTFDVPTPTSVIDEPPSSLFSYLPAMLPRSSKLESHAPHLVLSLSIFFVLKSRAHSIASRSFSTSPHLLQVSIDEPSCHDSLPSTASSRSEGTIYPTLVIRPSVDWVALSLYASGLQNTDYAQALLGVIITLANFKGAWTSLKDVMMRCYRVTTRYLT